MHGVAAKACEKGLITALKCTKGLLKKGSAFV